LAPWFPRVREDPAKAFDGSGSGFYIGHALTEQDMRSLVERLRWPFYVYVLCSESGGVFYVGKGTGDRVFHHRREAEAGGASEKCRVIRILGDRLRYGLFAACQDEDWALMLESTLINLDYQNLTNIKPGRVEHIVNACYFDPELRQAVRHLKQTLLILRRMDAEQRHVEDAFILKHPQMADLILAGRAGMAVN
jgi:hypothetical protein